MTSRIAFMLAVALPAASWAQEAESGFDLRTTLSTAVFHSSQLAQAPRNGSELDGGFRAMLYPTWKLSRGWTFAGAVQVHSRPYFSEQFTTQGRGVRGDILQAHLDYSRFWDRGSLVVRAGQLSSAFGSFLLRYDESMNPMISMPLSYGYYYAAVTTYGLMGAQADAVVGSLDFRLQFANSSPTNRRSILDKDQFGSWAGGAGVSIVQGFRVGVSGYRGPYLHRGHPYYFDGEAPPRDLPASAAGIDVQFGRGPWNVNGEIHKFVKAYRAVPFFHQHNGYVEARRVLHPRWYVAGRVEYLRTNRFQEREVYEGVVGWRWNTRQLLKIGWRLQANEATGARTLGKAFVAQLVTTLPLVSIARD